MKALNYILIISAFLFSNHNVAKELLCTDKTDDCTFVVLNETTQQIEAINSTRSIKALSPFSTFKVVNSLIALDTNVISTLEQSLTYDKDKYPQQPWWPPIWKLPSYKLKSAFQFSMVPVYRQLAFEIGEQKMQNYLQQFNYGNQDLSSGLDDFWLNGSIKISAVEQVKFLQKLYQKKLGLSQSTYTKFSRVMLKEATDSYKLYAKTGAGKIDSGAMLGWYVGYVEKNNNVYYFALNFERDSYAEMKKDRESLLMNHLKNAGIL